MLHTVNKSPYERKTLDNCLRTAAKGNAILLIEDAVYGAMSGTSYSDAMTQAAKDFKVYVLGPDLTARGMSEDKVIDGITVVDYSGFVDLTVENNTVHAWL